MGCKMSSSSPVEQIESYPHLDDDGNVKAYKSGGRWVNWWARNVPGGPTIMAGFAFGKDDSGIPKKVSMDLQIGVMKIQVKV